MTSHGILAYQTPPFPHGWLPPPSGPFYAGRAEHIMLYENVGEVVRIPIKVLRLEKPCSENVPINKQSPIGP